MKQSNRQKEREKALRGLENFMQRQLHDDRAGGINWGRQDEQDTESSHVHPGAEAGQRVWGVPVWGCVSVCTEVSRVNKHEHN